MRKCEVHGCDRKHAAHGYCLLHYKRMRTHGTTEPRAKHDPPTCEHCTAQAVARGWCAKHYAQWKTHGDPLHTDRLRATQGATVVNQWGYLQRRGKKTIANGHRLIHREVAGALPGEHVHHINGVKTDNRPENLWVASHVGHNAAHSSLQEAAFEAVRAGLIAFSPDGTYSLNRSDNASTAC